MRSSSQHAAAFDRTGHYSSQLTGASRIKFASTRLQGTPEENKGVSAGSLAHFGTYSADAAGTTLTFHVEPTLRERGSDQEARLHGVLSRAIVPLLINWSMRQRVLLAYRGRIIPAAEGCVLEIGFVTGGAGARPDHPISGHWRGRAKVGS